MARGGPRVPKLLALYVICSLGLSFFTTFSVRAEQFSERARRRKTVSSRKLRWYNDVIVVVHRAPTHRTRSRNGAFFICGRTCQVRHLRRLESPLQTYYLTELLNRRAIRVRPHSCSRVRLRLSGSLLVEAALPVAGVPVTRLSHMIGRDLEGCGPFFFFSPLFAFPFVGMLGTQREAFG